MIASLSVSPIMDRTTSKQGAALAFGLLSALASLSPSAAWAQAAAPAPDKLRIADVELSPEIEVRVRGEYRNNPPDLGGAIPQRASAPLAAPPVENAWGITERARVGLGAERGMMAARLTLQDARIWGAPAEGVTLASPATFRERQATGFGAYEAWAELRGSGVRPSFLRLGRQAVSWGEGRLLGTADFSPAGRALDAVRARLVVGDLDLEALAVLLEAPRPVSTAVEGSSSAAGTTSGTELLGVRAGWALSPLLQVELFGFARVADGDAASTAVAGSAFVASRAKGEKLTGALRLSGQKGGFQYGLEGAYQVGKLRGGAGPVPTNAPIAAFAISGHLQDTLRGVTWSPTLRLAGSYASGDPGKGGTYTQFDPLLPDPQRFHGQMDLFGFSNLVDLAGRVEVVPLTDTTLGFEYRYAHLAERRGEWIGSYLSSLGRNGLPSSGDPPGDLGHELDARFTYRPHSSFHLTAAYSALLLGEGARAVMASSLRGTPDGQGSVAAPSTAHYTFLQATVRLP